MVQKTSDDLIRAIKKALGPMGGSGGELYWVNGNTGNDLYSGTTPEEAFLTVGAAIAVMVEGDSLVIMAGTYNESIVQNVQGVTVLCLPGAIFTYTGVGTFVIGISGDRSRWSGGEVNQAGMISLALTANQGCIVRGVMSRASNMAFYVDGIEHQVSDVKADNYTVGGAQILTQVSRFTDILLDGLDTAVIGMDIRDNNNVFERCRTCNNTTNSFLLTGDKNVFVDCTDGGTDGPVSDAGTNNTWINPGDLHVPPLVGSTSGTGLDIQAAMVQAGGTVTIPQNGFYVVDVHAINGNDETAGLTGGAYTLSVRNTASNADTEVAKDVAVQVTAAHSMKRVSRPLYLTAAMTVGVWIQGVAGDSDVDVQVRVFRSSG